MMDLARRLALLEDHRIGMLELIGAGLAVTTDGGEDARAQLARVRWLALHRLRAYQLFAHEEVYDPLVAHGTPRQRRVAVRMRAGTIAMGESFVAYVGQWGLRTVEAEWDDYRLALRLMTDGLRRHVARERALAPKLIAAAGERRAIDA